MPKVSIIIPTYNRAVYVRESIDSVLAQTYADFEIIVVDDGSADDTQAVLQPFVAQGTIRYARQENRGESAARNQGIALATGEYIAFLDSDDLFTPTKLEKQVAYLDAHPEIGLVHSWYAKFEDGGRELGIRDTSKLTGKIYPNYLLDWSILMVVPSVMVRATVLAQVGGFDESIRWGPDLDMWRRITCKFQIGVIPEVLCKIRVHPGNISADKVSAAASFARYLQKAFDDDASLGPVFRRKAMSKMYANVAHNILSAGDTAQIKHVRHFSLKAIGYWPLQFSAYLGFLGSFLGCGLRVRLLKVWRAWRYPAQGAQIE